MALSYSEKLKTVQERIFSLDPRFAMVGWFSRNRRSNDVCIPLPDLRVVTLEKSRGEEWLLSALPAMHKKGQVIIEGNWYEPDSDRVLAYSTLAREGWRSAGVVKSVRPGNKGREHLDPAKDADQKLIDCAYALTDTDVLENQLGFNRFGDDFLSVPTFLTPMPARGYVKLRDGKELDEAVLHCARYGRWNISDVPGLVAPSHGKAERLDDGCVKFTHADRDGDPCAVEETFGSPVQGVREKIYRVFGVEPLLELSPAPAEGETVWMQPPACLFLPIHKGNHKFEGLAAHRNYQAMRYMAALNSLEGSHGLAMMDYALTQNDRMPWVHLGSMNSRIQRVKIARRALQSAGSDHRVVLFDLGQTLLHSQLRLSKLGKTAKAGPQPESEAQPLRVSAEAAVQ